MREIEREIERDVEMAGWGTASESASKSLMTEPHNHHAKDEFAVRRGTDHGFPYGVGWGDPSQLWVYGGGDQRVGGVGVSLWRA